MNGVLSKSACVGWQSVVRGPAICRSGCTLRTLVLVELFKALDLLLGFIFRDAVGLLNFARQLVALAGNLVEVIVSEFPPLCFHLALELLPVPLNDIPVHINSFRS